MSTITALGIGSGLDLSGLLDQLAGAERQKLAPIQQQKTSYQSKISAFGQLKSALSQFQAAAAKLGEAAAFNSVKSNVSGTAVTAAAGSTSQPGSYQIEVTNLARAYSIAAEGVVDKTVDLGAATLTLKLGNGEERVVEVDATKSSLEDIRNAINAEADGVSASIVNDGSGTPYRLVLASSRTGTESAITEVNFGALAGTLTLDTNTEVAAENAALTVNGISVSSQTNMVEDAIQGVSLRIAEEGSATLAVESDDGAITKLIEGFVTAYNGLQTNMRALTSYNAETGTAGTLLGDATLRGIQSRVRVAMGAGAAEGDLRLLSDIGISLQLDGTLKIDKTKLEGIVTNDKAALTTLFAGNGGIAGQMEDTVDQILASKGILDSATTGLGATITRLNERSVAMERGIEATIARYRTQFGQLDSMIARMNSTSGYLTQQFDTMNAQLRK